MKRRKTQQDANWSGVPSLSRLWMAALLRLVAMSFASLASILGMRLSRPFRECHTDVPPEVLPQRENETIEKESDQAVRHDSNPTTALMLTRTRSVRPSKHEGVLTAASCKPLETHQDRLDLFPLIPANAGTQGGTGGLFRRKAAAAIRNKPWLGSWIPTFVWGSTRSIERGEIAPI